MCCASRFRVGCLDSERHWGQRTGPDLGRSGRKRGAALPSRACPCGCGEAVRLPCLRRECSGLFPIHGESTRTGAGVMRGWLAPPGRAFGEAAFLGNCARVAPPPMGSVQLARGAAAEGRLLRKFGGELILRLRFVGCCTCQEGQDRPGAPFRRWGVCSRPPRLSPGEHQPGLGGSSLLLVPPS